MLQPVFPTGFSEAVALQKEWAPLVKIGGRPRNTRIIAGVDVSYVERGGWSVAAVVVLQYPSLETLRVITARAPTPFPYIPGLLSFREAPVCYDLLKPLSDEIDVLLVDGQGLAHPRRFGIACHLGVLLDVPTIGCAKSRLYGDIKGPLGYRRGASRAIADAMGVLGRVVRTRDGVRPVFVSVGHRAALEWAVPFVLSLAPRYRVPEPTRRAHLAVSAARKEIIS